MIMRLGSCSQLKINLAKMCYEYKAYQFHTGHSLYALLVDKYDKVEQ